MPYNVANNLRVAMPDAIGVDQLKRRNLLADQEMANDQQRNALYGQQIEQNDQRMQADQHAAAIEQVKAWAPGAIAQVEKDPSLLPQFLAAGQRLGVFDPKRTPDTVTPQDVAQLKVELGLMPAQAPVPFDQTPEAAKIRMQGEQAMELERLRQRAPKTAGEAPKPQLVDVRLPDGTVQKQWVHPGQGTGTPVGAPGKPGADENRTFTRADKLRDEFNAASKELVTVGDNYAKIQEVSADNSAAGDLSLIFSYMKMLDPNSVVREQEFANAQNAAGVPDRIRASYNKVISGERLSPNQRADFIKQAGNVYNAQNKRHQETVVKRYTAMAKRWNIDPQDVVGDLTVALPQPAAAAPPAATAAPAGAPKRVKVDAEGNVIGN